MENQITIITISRTVKVYSNIINYIFPTWVSIWKKNGCAFSLGSKLISGIDVLYRDRDGWMDG